MSTNHSTSINHRMGGFYCPNLTVIDESEVNLRKTGIFGRAIVAKVPPAARHVAHYHSIQDAILDQTDIYIEIENISEYGPDFLIIAESNDIATHLMNKLYLSIESCIIPLVPWTLDYGATTLTLPLSLANDQPPPNHRNTSHRSEKVDDEIIGILPRLRYPEIIHRLFQNIGLLMQHHFHTI